jgi:type 1 glutamine amidotransferase
VVFFFFVTGYMNCLSTLLVVLFVLAGSFGVGGADKTIVLVAGTPSHRPGEHEFNAGTTLLKKCLDRVDGVKARLYTNGWPEDPKAFQGADAIFLYLDGGRKHPVVESPRRKLLGEMMRKGVGLGCAHFAVEVPKDRGGLEFLDWIGGYYELGYSINPIWTADFESLPQHPITRGVQPFAVNDEWYFNIRFRPEPKGVTPILIATPSDETRQNSYGPYPHVVAARGRAEVLMWAIERADGGRGFGFTGGHFHRNWGDENFRKIVLNALLWMAKVEVPSGGVSCPISAKELKENLDSKGEK